MENKGDEVTNPSLTAEMKVERATLPAFAAIFVSLLLLSGILARGGPAWGADLFVTPAGSGTTCSRLLPCSLETAVGEAEDADAVYVATGTYTGTGENVVYLKKSIFLYGGWNGSSVGPVVRSPEKFPTTLDGESSRRVIHISSGTAPTVDGFIVTGGNATGLVADCPSTGYTPDGCGGGIFAYDADPTISHNVIQDNVAATTTNFPTTYIGYGGGIYLSYSTSATVRDNRISNNTGSLAGDAQGGGIYLRYCGSATEVTNNEFIENIGSTGLSKTGWGGAASLSHGELQLKENNFRGNTASSTGSSQGSAIYVWYGTQEIQGNTITESHRTDAVYLGYFGGNFQGNRVVDNDTLTAVHLPFGTGTQFNLTNNIISGTGTHTLLVRGHSGGQLSVSLSYNTLVGDGAQYGVYIEDYCTVTMDNNIVAGYSDTGILVVGGSSTVDADHTLFWKNGADGERGTNPVDGNPAFVLSAASDYRIRPWSVARDAAIAPAPALDIDGESRPQGAGFDIGADECWLSGPSSPPVIPPLFLLLGD